MKPHFVDHDGYRAWLSEWRDLYNHLSSEIVAYKHRIKDYQRQGLPQGGLVKERKMQRVMATKLMTVRNEAKIRWQNLEDARRSVREQMADFPLTVEGCRNIDFHFNKKSLELPFIPMWVVKAKGKSYYVNHVDCSTAWTTRETPEHPSTKGSIRIKRGSLHIDENGDAVIS
jgi:hypothetical protein